MTPVAHGQHDANHASSGDNSVGHGIAGSIATNLLLAASFLPNLEAALRVAALFLSVCVSGVTIHSALSKRKRNRRKTNERHDAQ
jgi:hypothetical protein